jgi:target of EGR1 protein 1
MLSLGISCFQAQSESGAYRVHTFNITMFCQNDYTVEASALRFLVAHGFDFNRQIQLGVPYHRSPPAPPPTHKLTKQDEQAAATLAACPLRALFRQIITVRKPVVLHNALVDLIFLYQHLFADLPASLATFVADLTLMFPTGIIDTKYVAEYHRRESASFLEYLFRKWQRRSERARLSGQPHIALHFSDDHGHTDPILLPEVCAEPLAARIAVAPCSHYANHGHCRLGAACTHSHALDVILDHEEQLASQARSGKRRRKDKNKRKGEAGEEAQCAAGAIDEEQALKEPGLTHATNESDAHADDAPHPAHTDWPVPSHGHRAGFDAFMTGFCAADCLLFPGGPGSSSDAVDSAAYGALASLLQHRNKVYLSAKALPLLIVKSRFASCSPAALALAGPIEA